MPGENPRMSKRKAGSRPPTQQQVFETLAACPRPLSAYQILDRLRPHGVTAPPTVYRALERLIAEGRAHRLESCNAFVACAHPAHAGRAAFAICDGCGSVTEFETGEAFAALDGWAAAQSFRTLRASIEVSGLCAGCQVEASP